MMESVRIDPVALDDLLGAQAPSVLIHGMSVSSSSIEPGGLFIALPGRHLHGATFASQAIAQGAVAIVTDRQGAALIGDAPVPVVVHDHPRAAVGIWAARLYRTKQHALRVVGVTGTNGKTTVAHLIAAGATSAGMRVGIIGTLGVQYPEGRLDTGHTTPEAPLVHRMLADFAVNRIDLAVIEVSSIAMSEHRVDGVPFSISAFTQLSQDHLDYHGTMEAYFEAKAELFTSTYTEHAVVGIDDAWGRRLADGIAVPCTTWSTQAGDVTGRQIPHGVRIIRGSAAPVDMPMPMAGEFNIANATCAAAVLDVLGIDLAAHPNAFAEVTIPGRMEAFNGPRGISVIVDYAHTPDAIERVVRASKSERRLLVVIGAGGDRDQGKRRAMGAAAGHGADVVIVTDDNPRSEDPAAIRAAVMAGAHTTKAQVIEVGDRRAAIAHALTLAGADGTVLVLGKGHEGGQEVNGVITAFDDRQVVRELIEGGDS